LIEAAAEQAARGPLEAEAEAWIAGHVNTRHLLRTRDWTVALAPDAGEALRIAALTHDIERNVPGGPPFRDWDDPQYVAEHAARSAEIVGGWLSERGADAELVRATCRLVERHEVGGTPEADVLQAADSLSFLEVNAWRARLWVEQGLFDLPRAQSKLDAMRDRIAIPEAAAAAVALHAAATAELNR
jgi:hypothetical protein